MAVRFYDEALVAKLKKWTQDTDVTLLGVNETKRRFEVLADKNNDQPIKLPLITLSRNGGYTILSKNKKPLSYDGNTFVRSNERSALLNGIPISIQYQIDIYTRYLEEADEYARNIVFNIVNYPKLNIEIPYEDLGITHDANIMLNSDVDDNSDIPERLIPGQFTRLTIGIVIDDAYLFDVHIKKNLSIVEGQLQIAHPPKIDTEMLFTK